MKHTLPSGATLDVSESSFEDCDVLMSALASAGIGVQLAEDLTKLDVSVLKDALLKAYAAEDLKRAIFKCATRASTKTRLSTEGCLTIPS